jgi:hypothetical protein
VKEVIMLNVRALCVLATAAMLGAGCARYTQQSASGEVITNDDAKKTVVLHVDNLNQSPMELRTISNGRSLFVGSVGGQDSTSILLDPTLFPTASLYLAAIAADGRGAARVGPLGAGKGDIIKFTIQPALDLSRAIVVR